MDKRNSIPTGSQLITANLAAAYAALLAQVKVVAAYPITPQTSIIEEIRKWAKDYDIEFIPVEGEHSMVALVRGSTRVGVRSFTATSSHGLAYAHEQLHGASRERTPLVMINVNRALASPWGLHPELSDSLSQRDTGWMQFYCADQQEVLDTVLCAFKLAEQHMVPALVCYEGFVLSHSSAPVYIPTQEEVDRFLPKFAPPKEWCLLPENPVAYGANPDPEIYSKFQWNLHLALIEAGKSLEKVTQEFYQVFGRRKVGAIEILGNPKASTAIFCCGTIARTAQSLLESNPNLLLVRLHLFRPFPKRVLRKILAKLKRIAVVTRGISFGASGQLSDELKSVLYALTPAPLVFDFVAGLDGTDVTPNTLKWILDQTRNLPAEVSLETIRVPEEVK